MQRLLARRQRSLLRGQNRSSALRDPLLRETLSMPPDTINRAYLAIGGNTKPMRASILSKYISIAPPHQDSTTSRHLHHCVPRHGWSRPRCQYLSRKEPTARSNPTFPQTEKWPPTKKNLQAIFFYRRNPSIRPRKLPARFRRRPTRALLPSPSPNGALRQSRYLLVCRFVSSGARRIRKPVLSRMLAIEQFFNPARDGAVIDPILPSQ